MPQPANSAPAADVRIVAMEAAKTTTAAGMGIQIFLRIGSGRPCSSKLVR